MKSIAYNIQVVQHYTCRNEKFLGLIILMGQVREHHIRD